MRLKSIDYRLFIAGLCFLIALLAAFLIAAPAAAQETQTIVVSEGDSLIITTTTITTVRVIHLGLDTGTAVPPLPPTASPAPVLSRSGITAPVVIDGSQLAALTAGTIIATYNASGGGLFSRDHNGFGTGGHTTFRIRSGMIEARAQTVSASFLANGAGGSGSHRALYRWGTDGMSVWLDGVEVGTNAHDGSMSGNNADMVIGATCVQCVPGTTEPLGDLLDGTIDLLEIYDFRFSDTQAIAATQQTNGSLPTAAEIVAGIDSIGLWPAHLDMQPGEDASLLPLVFVGTDTYAALTDRFVPVLFNPGPCTSGISISATNEGAPDSYSLPSC